MCLIAFSCGREAQAIPDLGRALFERSELRSHIIWCRGEVSPKGPRTGENGFRPFCRNKRASSCGGETPFIKKGKPGFPFARE